MSSAADLSYEELTRAAPSILKRWSHRTRYEAALRAVEILPDCTVADYGAGDGHLLSLIAQRYRPAEMWAFEPCPDAGIAAAALGTTARIVRTRGELPDRRFDLVFCMEVLEHLNRQAMDEALSNIRRILRPEGKIIITVPVEIGPASLVKNIVRAAIGRGSDEASLSAMARSLFGRTQGIPRAADINGYICSHVGFDYRRLRPVFGAYGLKLESSRPSPLWWAPPGFNSQMTFVLGQVPIRP